MSAWKATTFPLLRLRRNSERKDRVPKRAYGVSMKTPSFAVLGLCLLVGHAHAQRLDAFDLLQYRAKDGTVKHASSVQEWADRRSEILLAMQSIMGPLPGDAKRCKLDVKTEDEADCGTYIRRLITYASEPNQRTPAYLCIPKTALSGRVAPGVLCLHPTENIIGHMVVVGLGGKAHRQYASELAERGFVTISPSYPQLAKYQPDLKGLGYESGTMKAIWDNIRAMDVLDSLTSVKHGAYAAIGHSLGGHNSVYTAAFDDRIKVIVSSSGLDSYPDYYGGKPDVWEHGKGWCQDRYMPKLAEYRGRLNEIPFDFPEIIGVLAPRHVFINSPLRDSNFRWQSVDKVVKAASAVYALHHAEANLQVEHPDSEHDFPDEQRFKAYALIEKVLK